MLDELDDYLEETYGQRFIRHPNRPKRGEAASSRYDGLFSATSKFTLGYGSERGRGYLIVIDISTLDHIDKKTRDQIETDAIEHLKQLIPRYLPDRKLEVVKDGTVYKLVGDFSLGSL